MTLGTGRAITAVALGVTLLVGGTGAMRSVPAGAANALDGAELRRAVNTAARAAYPDQEVGRVRCPARIANRVGERAECTVAVGDGVVVVAVTPRDRRGNVDLAAIQAVIPTAAAEQFVTANATAPATAECGSRGLLVLPPGATFLCTTTFTDGTVQQVLVAVRDTTGTIAISQLF